MNENNGLAARVAAAPSTTSDQLTILCAACNQPPESGKKLLGCARCKKVFYHDKNCQKRHFSSHHKKVCRKLAASFIGIDVVDSASILGRVAIAKNEFAAGEIVLAEVPAIVFDNEDGYVSLFSEFLNASPQVKESILDMHHSLEHRLGRGNESDHAIRYEIQRLQHKDKNLLTMEVARKIVSAVNHNAHDCTYVDKAKVYSYTHKPKQEFALYTLASKVEHSCVPNVTMNTSELGLMEYHALTPIQQGSRITFSYMEKVFLSPRKDRRAFLLENKNFVCKCNRCSVLDECNPFKCPGCNKEAMFEGGGKGGYLEGIHYCLFCKHEVASSEESVTSQSRKFGSFESRLESLMARLENGDLDLGDQSLKLQRDVASRYKSPLHWLHPSVWTLLSSVFASIARMNIQQRKSRSVIANCVRMSGYALLQEAKWTQQIIAIAYGWIKLEDVVNENNSTTQLKSIPSVDDVKELINDLIRGAKTSLRYPSPDVTYKIFQAGQDFLLEGDLGGDVAALFERFSGDLLQFPGLGDEQRNMIKTLVESKGRVNDFPNHLI